MVYQKLNFFLFILLTGFLHSQCSKNQKLPLTKEELVEVAKKAFGNSFSKLNSFEFKDYKENNTGYFGHYRQLKLTAQLDNGKISDFSLFVKSLK